jgi:hypothetical protein
MPSLYFLATDTRKPISRLIKAWTWEAFNHVSLTFSPMMKKSYSFSIAANGFSVENPAIWPPDTHFELRSAEVSDSGLLAARKFIARVKKKDLAFSYAGLVGIVLGRPMGGESAMFCAEFVERAARAAGLPPTAANRDPRLMTPWNVCNRPMTKYVASGLLKDYIGRRAWMVGAGVPTLSNLSLF